MPRLSLILRLTRPVYLLLAGLNYLLGSSIARYLGVPPHPAAFWLGLLAVLLAEMGMSLLVEVFRPANEPIVPDETRSERKMIHDAALYVSAAALTTTMVLAVLLYYAGLLPPSALFFLVLCLLVIILYAVPPLRLFDRGFGELLVSINIAYLSPSIGFLLQFGKYHPLLTVATVPLTLLSVGVLLGLDFQSYAADIKYERRTLLTRLGWESAVPLHHGLLLGAYILFAAAPLLGFSLGLIWPAFLSLPFALLQIYWLRNIALGAKPFWTLLTANAISFLGLTAYSLTLTFWLR
jgi:1,4-dihydroxy-2-naphthoate octaprenyltransferase